MSYGWDRNHNRTSIVTSAGTSEWSYRDDNSIHEVDAPGTASDYTFEYDDAGRLTDDGCNTYTYDDFDRVKTSTVSGTTACGGDSRTVTYAYDGLDRQRTSVVTGSSSGNGTTSSIYDGLAARLTGQKDAVNGATSKPEVLYQLDAGGTAMGMEQTGAGAGKSFLDTDCQGNVVNQVTTGDDLACAVVYDPFGGAVGAAGGGTSNGMCAAAPPSTTSASTTGNAVWYRGQTRDPSTGDYQLGVRSYDPATGAFTTPDAYRVASSATDTSVGVDPVTANTYSYVNGNPVNFADPSGHRRVCAGPNDPGPCEHAGYYGPGPTTKSLKQDKARNEAAIEAKQVEANAEFDIAGAALEVFGEVSGLADLERCVMDADMGSCFWTIAGIVGASIFKAGKAIKAGSRLLKAYQKFEKSREAAAAAVKSLTKHGDELQAMLAASIKADKAAARAAKAAKAEKARDAQQAVTAARTSKSTKTTHHGPDANSESFVYRGVAKDHPGYEDALRGNAIPRNVSGSTSAEAHNFGLPEDLADSPFISWSWDPAVAAIHAKEGGVILKLPTGKPAAGSPWKFEWSPDQWFEQEVLVRGPVYGAKRYR